MRMVKVSKGALMGNHHRGSDVELAHVLLYCALFFLVGFFGSKLFSNEDFGVGHGMRQERMMRGVDGVEEVELRSVPHGVTGESYLSLIPFQVLSWQPRALYFPEFASAEECQTIIRIARSSLTLSTLALREGETVENTKGIRTSTGTFITASEDSTGVLDRLEKRIATVTTIPRDHGEAFNILRYEIGQRYASHYDAFHPEQYGPQKSNRVATFLLYLTDVEEGGETMFPFENGSNMDIGYDYEKCIGLRVRPKRGDGLLFYSMLANGAIDLTSLHGSCPVIKGEKWVATKWLRDQKQD
uniref:procollagen-proline 4-dioxygenase n=1 Tax=Ananas comosus var. bracteatus TaxID=296719 RepID=A0A6V7Q4N4_ANACO|nr:unnamed protein product [Ananas comosus var. bracteatus]